MQKTDKFLKRRGYEDPDLSLFDLMNVWPQTIPIFMRHKMICVGCMIGPFHTVIDACQEYGLNEDQFRAELAKAITGDIKEPTAAD